jgi:hypothetical protein
MSGFEDVDHGYSYRDYLELIPPRCQGCKFAMFVIVAATRAQSDEDRPLAKIMDIDLRCDGYQGPDKTSNLYDHDPRLDRSGCPYADMILPADSPEANY